MTLLPRCDLATETREQLDMLLQQEIPMTASGLGPAAPAPKKIPEKGLPRAGELEGVTWRPRTGRQVAYLAVIGELIFDVALGINEALRDMAFWEETYALLHRTYLYDNVYLLISSYIILAVFGVWVVIGKMTCYLKIDRDGITWRPWYFPHHYPWSEVESIADERQPIVHVYRTTKPIILVQVRREKPLQIRAYRFRDPVDPKTGKVQKIEDVLRTYWEAFKQRVTEIPLEKKE